MKKILTVILLAVVIALTISSCKTATKCDAYKSHQSHSRY